ncbi:hypothetical protein [Chakrabartyella piscis]|uniref:hypothetical protein n=1 Tax=Chakrabartyella piscis TaxID=2918914 RepID=UPI002958773F|nr:hypothetical protein [Chakrabartyella piscis]
MKNTEKSKAKTRLMVWLYPEMWEQIDTVYESDNCKSRSEFIEKAVKFYHGYLTSTESAEYLSKILVNSMQATIKESENKHSGNLFRLAVEMNIMMNLLAASINVDEADIKKIRERCMQEVKKTYGKIKFEDAIAYQRGDG